MIDNRNNPTTTGKDLLLVLRGNVGLVSIVPHTAVFRSFDMLFCSELVLVPMRLFFPLKKNKIF